MKKLTSKNLILVSVISFMLAVTAVFVALAIINSGTSQAASTPTTQDELRVQAFLLQEAYGETNAERLGVNPNDTSTWVGFTFNESRQLTMVGNPKYKHVDSLDEKYLCGTLDVSDCKTLKGIYVAGNGISLNLTGATALTDLDVSGNSLPFDVSSNTALKNLKCFNSGLTSLDVSQNPALEVLFCTYNNLTSLDVSNNPALTELWLTWNKLTSLDVSQNPALKILDCCDNLLTSLDLSQNLMLKKVYWPRTNPNLRSIKVSSLSALIEDVSNPYDLIDSPLNNPNLLNPAIGSFVLFPFTVGSQTYAKAYIDGDHEIEFEIISAEAVPDIIFAEIQVTGSQIQFDVFAGINGQQVISYFILTPVSMNITDHKYSGSWDRFTADILDDEMNIILTYDYLSCTHDMPLTWTIVLPATCEEIGLKSCSCLLNCGYTVYIGISALGHDILTETLAPTCTTAGTESKTCQRNGCGHKTTQSIPALGGHLMSSDWATKTAATCTKDGLESKHCTRPGCDHTETRAITATPCGKSDCKECNPPKSKLLGFIDKEHIPYYVGGVLLIVSVLVLVLAFRLRRESSKIK